MNAWDKVKQDLATAGYSESQKKEFGLQLSGILNQKIEYNVVSTVYTFNIRFEVLEDRLFEEVALLRYTMSRLGLVGEDDCPNIMVYDNGSAIVFMNCVFIDRRNV